MNGANQPPSFDVALVTLRAMFFLSAAGLGLYLVEQTAKAHGGRVDFESEPGRGTTFHLRLPIRAGAET